MALMAVSRLAGLVLPATSKVLIDDVVGKSRGDLLWPLALAAGAATLVQAVTGFALSQVLGIAAQKSITEMRRAVQQHVTRLPVGYFDSTKTGVLISRIMNDAEGIRNLVGNGLVQLVGSIVTASIALGVLFWLNWRLTTATLVLLAAFGGVMALAFTRLRPIFRERGKHQRRGHRAAHRDAGRHPHRQGLHRRAARVAGLREGHSPPVPQRRQLDDRRLGRRRRPPPSSSASSACS